MATKWENAEFYLLFLSFLTLVWLILRSNIGKNKMSLRRWYTPSFNCLAATIGIDRDRPQSVMEAIDNCFAFRVADGYSGRPCKAIVCTPRVAVCDDFSSAVQSRWPIVCSIVAYRQNIGCFYSCQLITAIVVFWAILATRRSTNGC